MLPIALHPVPVSTWRHNDGEPLVGYHHKPLTYHKHDAQMDAITDVDTFEARYVRLIGGWRKGGKKGTYWSRGPDSFITLDTYSIGIPHFWALYFPEEFAEFIQDGGRTLVEWGIGTEFTDLMEDQLEMEMEITINGKVETHRERWWFLHEALSIEDPEDPRHKGKPYDEIWRPKRGFDHPDRWQQSWDWFPAMCNEIMRHPKAIHWQTDQLLGKVRGAFKVMKKHDWTKEFTLAALGRYANSRGVGGMRRDIRKAIKKIGSTDEDVVIDYVYNTWRNYGSRYKRIKRRFSSEPGTAPKRVSATRLKYDAMVPVRVDGTHPVFVREASDWKSW